MLKVYLSLKYGNSSLLQHSSPENMMMNSEIWWLQQILQNDSKWFVLGYLISGLQELKQQQLEKAPVIDEISLMRREDDI